ncbi:DNA topoisomerase IB [Paracoccus laeviglucosivorans]|uniref:DNA topoisomerase n=1 Tax=Paracoccus laeviglucosivorans TaxID=1197861 RepID=A0A521DQC3_9RHOB|nr:DNA topoisomerase IB [Paracoccus laeviglucosivorans]SMO73896.1 DNA topoisomerase-1 [Paracoccus laeviglucosivorans]
MPKDSAIVDPEDAAEVAGLVHVSDDMPGITRRRSGTGFSYRDAKGNTVRDKRVLSRIRGLVIPPAYQDVWICANPRGHLQATGRDARGRKQYRYHPRFREFRDSAKFEHMLEFAASLPRIRARVDADMSLRGLPAEKVLATVVHLLETTMIRVGNDTYARENKSHGLTTLRARHARIEGSKIRFRFKGKGGKEWDLGIRDRRVATIMRKMHDLPGQQLFQYLDEDGERCRVSSTEVNDYLREISGREVTAKDFRTWTGTVLAAMALAAYEAFDSEAAAKRNVRDAIATVAATLGNTPAICRKCYIHPTIIDAYLADDLKIVIRDEIDETLGDTDLRDEERQILRLLKKRLKT